MLLDASGSAELDLSVDHLVYDVPGNALIAMTKTVTSCNGAGGSAGAGSILVTDVPVGDLSSGFGTGTTLWDIELLGPGCEGLALTCGTGLAGNGGFVPSLSLSGCPDIGNVFTLAIADVNGGAAGLQFVSLSGGSVPFKGGTFLLGAPILIVPCIAPGTPGVAGAGSMALPASLSDPGLLGLDLYLQCGYADAAAVNAVSLTNGLRLHGG